MKSISLDILREKIKESINWSNVCLSFGYVRSTNTIKKLKRLCIDNTIDFSHFDSRARKSKYEIINKICPVCKIEFKTQRRDDRKEKTYCSKKCCNSLNLGGRYSKETIDKRVKWIRDKYSSKNSHVKISVSKTNKKHNSLKKIFIKKTPILRNCLICGDVFSSIKNIQNYCSLSCSGKARWKNPDYRNNLISKIKERVKNGTHKGWQSRNILSYPEQFFKTALNNNGYENSYKINFPIAKKSLGVNCTACYFLDFYFEDIKLNIEIDGKQHDFQERKESDKKRDELLNKYGIEVYRIKWKNPAKHKDYINEKIKELINYIELKYLTI